MSPNAPVVIAASISAKWVWRSSRSNLSYLDTAHHEGTSGYYVSKLIAHFSTSQGVSEEDAQPGFQQLEVADQKRDLGLCISQY